MADPAPLDDQQLQDLVAFLDQEADEPTTHRLEAELNRSGSLRTHAENLRKTWEMLDYLPRLEPKGDFTQRTIDKLATIPPERPSLSVSGLLIAPVKRLPWGKILSGCLMLAVGYGAAEALLRWQNVPLRLEDDPLLRSDPGLIDQLSAYFPVESTEFLELLAQHEAFAEPSEVP